PVRPSSTPVGNEPVDPRRPLHRAERIIRRPPHPSEAASRRPRGAVLFWRTRRRLLARSTMGFTFKHPSETRAATQVLVETTTLSLREIARRRGIPRSTLDYWVAHFRWRRPAGAGTSARKAGS